MASGDICAAIGYSGDILQANDRAAAAQRDYEIKYVFPKEGSLLWFDCWIVPRDVQHYDNSMKWIDYLLRDNVAASISNEIRYILPVTKAMQQIDETLKTNTSVNLPPELLEKAYFPKPPTAKQSRIHNRIWNSMKLNSTASDEDEAGMGWN